MHKTIVNRKDIQMERQVDSLTGKGTDK